MTAGGWRWNVARIKNNSPLSHPRELCDPSTVLMPPGGWSPLSRYGSRNRASLLQRSQGPLKVRGPNVRVLNHDVLMGDESVDAIVPAFPPVVRSPLVKQQGCPLLEGQLSGCPAHVVKLGNGLDGLTL